MGTHNVGAPFAFSYLEELLDRTGHGRGGTAEEWLFFIPHFHPSLFPHFSTRRGIAGKLHPLFFALRLMQQTNQVSQLLRRDQFLKAIGHDQVQASQGEAAIALAGKNDDTSDHLIALAK